MARFRLLGKSYGFFTGNFDLQLSVPANATAHSQAVVQLDQTPTNEEKPISFINFNSTAILSI